MPPSPNNVRLADDAVTWLWRGIGFAAILAIVVWLYVATAHVLFPGDLSAYEGAVVDQIRRLIEGQPLYARPTLDYAPLLYGPLLFWLSALFAWIGDIAFVVPRGLSLLACLISAWCIALLVRRQSGHWLPGLIAAGLFFIAAPFADHWYALAHVDALQLALMLLALLLWTGPAGRARLIGCGVLLMAAMLAKQSAFFVALVIGIDGLAFRRRDLLAVAMGTVAAAIPAALWLASDSGLWAWRVLVEVPQGFGLHFDSVWSPFFRFRLMLPAVLLGGTALIVAIVNRTPLRSILLPAIALIGVGLLGRLHPGSGWNIAMPMIASLCLVIGLGASWAMRHPVKAWRWIGLAAIALQFALLAYDPRRAVPSSQTIQNFHAAQQAIADLPPTALLMGNGFFIGRIAGSEPLAWRDYLAGLNEADRQAEIAGLQAELARRNFPPVVVTPLGALIFAPVLEKDYGAARPLMPPPPQTVPNDKSAILLVFRPR